MQQKQRTNFNQQKGRHLIIRKHESVKADKKKKAQTIQQIKHARLLEELKKPKMVRDTKSLVKPGERNG